MIERRKIADRRALHLERRFGVAAPEPSGEFVRVHQSAFALMEYLLTQGPTFNIPDNIWIPFVDALSADEQKG